MTSSITTIKEHAKEKVSKDKIYHESDWSDIDVCRPYEKSKTMAEKAAWQFLDSLPESEKFELVTIQPGDILGPTTIYKNFASKEFIRNMMINKYPGCPKIHYPLVDVQDVVQAHFNALVIPEAKN
jgi:nucleoside-diphosphate-sugar epimerase